jgi:ParB family chromosome partitioning protein
MTQPQRRLGRGLEALLGRSADAVEQTPPSSPNPNPAASDEALGGGDDRLIEIDVRRIDANPYQPRQEFDEAGIAELAESIRLHGVVQPIVVRRAGDRFELISGERRLRAAIQADQPTIPACIREADDREAAELAIIENFQRKDLSPLEKAACFQKYVDRYACTHDELAHRISADRSTVTNLMRLLELPSEVQDALRAGRITQGHARALLPLGDEMEQINFLMQIELLHLSVRDTEEKVQLAIQLADLGALAESSGVSQPLKIPKRRKQRSEHLASMEQRLRTSLGAKVEIRTTARGRGKLIIHFKNQAEFERLNDLLGSLGEKGMRNDAG